ncbi:MAG: hypothetical protein OEX19_05815 [Gammaproteobacteria bacterium]|nr:hypothetical protein [Gammaproteobacteria bacterium]
MKLISISRQTLLLATMLSLTGCASTFLKAYPGKLQPLSETGVVTCEKELMITAVDGKLEQKIFTGGALTFMDCTISLLPGEHAISFYYLHRGSYLITSTREVTHKLNVEKGQIYRIKYTMNNQLWKPWIEKLEGDELERVRKDVMSRLKDQASG